MNWNRFSLFKLPNRHKRFNYVPRYYDPDKEELQEKIERAKAQGAETWEDRKVREITFKSTAKNSWGNSDFKSQSMRSNVRLIVILAVVIILFYYVFIGLDGLGYIIDNNLDKLK